MKKIFKLSTEISEMSIHIQKKSRGGGSDRSYEMSTLSVPNWNGSHNDWDFPTVPDDYSNSGVLGGSNSGVESPDPDPVDNINDPDGVLEGAKAKFDERIEALKQAIKSNQFVGEQQQQNANELLDAYQQAKNNIELLENSDNKYRIEVTPNFDNNPNEENAEFTYDKDTGEFVIRVETDNLGLLSHEIEHAVQLENQELYLDSDGNIGGYDINDEVDAYDIQHKINHGILFNTTNLSGVSQSQPYEITPEEIYIHFPGIYDHFNNSGSGEHGSTSSSPSSGN